MNKAIHLDFILKVLLLQLIPPLSKGNRRTNLSIDYVFYGFFEMIVEQGEQLFKVSFHLGIIHCCELQL